MWYVYRDCSVAGWAALAAFVIYSAGFSAGKHRCAGWRAWWSLGVLGVVLTGLLVGVRYYFATTRDFSIDQFYPAARVAVPVAAVLFLGGLAWGWFVGSPARPKGSSTQS